LLAEHRKIEYALVDKVQFCLVGAPICIVTLPPVSQKLCQELKLGLGRSDGGGEVAVALVVLAALEQLGLFVVVIVNQNLRIGCHELHEDSITSPKVLLNHIRSDAGVQALII
jgi:hypothetical protein